MMMKARTVLSLFRIAKLFARLVLVLTLGLSGWATIVLSHGRCFACRWHLGMSVSRTFALHWLLPRVPLQLTRIRQWQGSWPLGFRYPCTLINIIVIVIGINILTS